MSYKFYTFGQEDPTERIDAALQALEIDIDALEASLADVNVSLDALDAGINALEARVTALEADRVERTTADITLYVSTAGNDANDGLTLGTAKLTIQAAVDSVPSMIDHAVVIEVGEGAFAGFEASNFFTSTFGTLLIRGVLGAPTLTTGTTSGTATAGTTTTKLVDAGQNWTVNELRGMFLYNQSQYFVIQSNDATSVTIHKPKSGMLNKPYSIVIPLTRITSAEPNGFGILTRNCFLINSDNIAFHNFQIEGTYGFAFLYTAGGQVERCRFINCTYGFYAAYMSAKVETLTTYASTGYYGMLFLQCAGKIEHIDDMICYDNPGGNLISSSLYLNVEYLAIIDSGVSGLSIEQIPYFDVKKLTIDNSASYGLAIDASAYASSSFVVSATSIEASNNGDSGIFCGRNSVLSANDIIGTGNVGHGVELENGASVTFKTGTTITGALGNATINEGVSTLTWATDFAANRDKAINLANGCRIERID